MAKHNSYQTTEAFNFDTHPETLQTKLYLATQNQETTLGVVITIKKLSHIQPQLPKTQIQPQQSPKVQGYVYMQFWRNLIPFTFNALTLHIVS